MGLVTMEAVVCRTGLSGLRELICAYGGSEGRPLTTAGISLGDGPVSWDM